MNIYPNLELTVNFVLNQDEKEQLTEYLMQNIAAFVKLPEVDFWTDTEGSGVFVEFYAGAPDHGEKIDFKDMEKVLRKWVCDQFSDVNRGIDCRLVLSTCNNGYLTAKMIVSKDEEPNSIMIVQDEATLLNGPDFFYLKQQNNEEG